MDRALVIGGGAGIGLSIALQLAAKGIHVVIVDKNPPTSSVLNNNIEYLYADLLLTHFEWLDNFQDINYLFYSAGFGRVAPFDSLLPKEIENIFKVNTIGVFKVLNYFIERIKEPTPFYCGVMVSIAARIASPLFSVYSASKAALYRGLEAINTELIKCDSPNRVLEVSPGSIKGTSFNGGKSDYKETQALALNIISKMEAHDTLFIPEYDSIFKNVLHQYQENPLDFSLKSYQYKLDSNRLNLKPQIKVGYLSGTFDLFHIGHLNLLKRAKQYCDYLVVGVHKDASHKGKKTVIPFEERKAIVEGIEFVDKVIESEREDWDIFKKGIVKYDLLFVGSDYKGTERFNRYEEYFVDKGVKIIYFPYTQGRSSTQLREQLSNR
ncbi:MAG: SDR family NAD(P)-dependent oxidoreductase [Bacteroides sp.]|nr:SDR family NAD(P)-dependent oxidoreductase [Bacteroides sp.]